MDFNNMKKDALKAGIKDFNAQHPDRQRLTVGGNVADLRRRLQVAYGIAVNDDLAALGLRESTATSILASGSIVASTTLTTNVKGAGTESVMLRRTGVHSITADCLDEMNVGYDRNLLTLLSGDEETPL